MFLFPRFGASRSNLTIALLEIKDSITAIDIGIVAARVLQWHGQLEVTDKSVQATNRTNDDRRDLQNRPCNKNCAQESDRQTYLFDALYFYTSPFVIIKMKHSLAQQKIYEIAMFDVN